MSHYDNRLTYFFDLFFNDINQDIAFYEYFIKNNGEPALEIGSGTGRLLLEYLQQGLKVEGLEPSQEMIEICKQKAERHNFLPVVLNQNLENLDTEKRYKTIYFPLFVFQYITDFNDAVKSLKKVYEHLLPGGKAIISLFIPWNDPTGTYENAWRINSVKEIDSQTIIFSESITLDKFEQIQTKYLKFDVYQESKLIESFLSTLKLRFYSKNELSIILQNVGFSNIEMYGDYMFQEATGNSQTLIFIASK